MSARRTTVDVSGLPELVFGHRNLVWWGTVGFMVIEGTTLAILAAAYLFIMQNFHEWPPAHIPSASLWPGTANLLVLLASNFAAWKLSKAGERCDEGGVKRWLLVCVAFAVAFVALRAFEFRHLNVHWDQNAYGTVVWALVFAHFSLLAVELGEILIFTAIYFTGRNEEKHFPDLCDAAMYWYFMTLVWVPVYFLVYLLPRIV
jgi:cytochrome c oxidase subunit I+III